MAVRRCSIIVSSLLHSPHKQKTYPVSSVPVWNFLPSKLECSQEARTAYPAWADCSSSLWKSFPHRHWDQTLILVISASDCFKPPHLCQPNTWKTKRRCCHEHCSWWSWQMRHGWWLDGIPCLSSLPLLSWLGSRWSLQIVWHVPWPDFVN